MPFFQWSEGFSVGVPKLDEQHKQLIDMINGIQGSHDQTVAADTVKKMFDYAALHFQDEEALLRQVHYRELGNQIREHKAFLDKAVTFSGQPFASAQDSQQLALYLRGWLSHHILEVDMKYKQSFFKKSG